MGLTQVSNGGKSSQIQIASEAKTTEPQTFLRYRAFVFCNQFMWSKCCQPLVNHGFLIAKLGRYISHSIHLWHLHQKSDLSWQNAVWVRSYNILQPIPHVSYTLGSIIRPHKPPFRIPSPSWRVMVFFRCLQRARKASEALWVCQCWLCQPGHHIYI